MAGFLTDQAVFATDPTTEQKNQEARDIIREGSDRSVRSSVLTQNPAGNLAMNEVQEKGFGTTSFTPTATDFKVVSGIDMVSGDNGGLVWFKNRDAVQEHLLFDTVRGASKVIYSSTALAEANQTFLDSFDSDGFTVSADTLGLNQNWVAWQWKTTDKKVGFTNRAKPYTAHYNARMGFSIVGYEGDGVDGHEIPHFLTETPDLALVKNRDSAYSWIVQSNKIGNISSGDYLTLDLNAVIGTGASEAAGLDSLVYRLGSSLNFNTSGQNTIAYFFRSVEGFSKITTYVATGQFNQAIDLGLDMTKVGSFVMIKNMSQATDWVMYDNTRGVGYSGAGRILYANLSNVESSVTTREIDFTSSGVVLENDSVSPAINTAGDTFLVMAFTSDYFRTTDTDTVINDHDVTIAKGFDVAGQNLDQTLVTGAGVVNSLTEGKHYIWVDENGSFGADAVMQEYNPVIGKSADGSHKTYIGEVKIDASGRPVSVKDFNPTVRVTDITVHGALNIQGSSNLSSFGISQKWKNMTSIRKPNSIYTNDTGKVRRVTICYSSSNSGSPSTIKIDGEEIRRQQAGHAGDYNYLFDFTVDPGESYVFYNASGFSGLLFWKEKD